jgi:glycopeptide antibiotics resistance protein
MPTASKKKSAPRPRKRRQNRKPIARKTSTARRRSSKRPPLHVVALRALAVLAAFAAIALFSYWAYRLTLTPIHDHGQATGNTHPGRTLRFYLDRPSVKEALIQIGGNLALLAPLGILLPVVFTRLRGLIWITVTAALISLVIETSQGTLVAGRAFDTDDVILNTAGVLITYLLAGRRIARLVHGNRLT